MQAVRPRLQTGTRALLHPCRRVRSSWSGAEQPAPEERGCRAVTDDAASVRQHFEQFDRYELSYIESKGRMKKGDRAWQITLGRGFKCNSAVLWKCLRTVRPPRDSAWADCVHRYPVELTHPSIQLSSLKL